MKKCFRCCPLCIKNKQELILNKDNNNFKEKNQKPTYKDQKNKNTVIQKNDNKPFNCDCSCYCFGDLAANNFNGWKKSKEIMPFFKTDDIFLHFDENITENDLKSDALKLFNEVKLLIFILR